MKKSVYIIILVLWTALCICGTYLSTIKSVEINLTPEGYYEVTYHNTGSIHIYE